ncbi:phytoene/squalene synthase family protein [Leucobacter japonicus]|uniref:phytoene/squalene synthase family protein n=1 Tax=Leucobacter japonicus TaxID=1461259 RepID=UPI0006A7912F|nr:squalene/phytoene synthase family protein [Leucobacter japonicus]
MKPQSPLDRYSRSAMRASAVVIRSYSTSFGAATRLLGARHRAHVRNIYALVRVADELVDGVTDGAGLSADAQRDALDRLEDEVGRAVATGYSSDLIVHAFAQTARAARIDASLTAPFFASMRADLQVPVTPANEHPGANSAEHPAASASEDPPHRVRGFDAEQHGTYVYGSAEVVGLMCLRVFTREQQLDALQQHRLERGARSLGAAFQNVNFLRDLADDTERLGRNYLGSGDRLTDADRVDWLRRIDAELADARAVLPLLPKDARTAVRCALDLFACLSRRIARTSIDELYARRVRVPDWQKSEIIARAIARTAVETR